MHFSGHDRTPLSDRFGQPIPSKGCRYPPAGTFFKGPHNQPEHPLKPLEYRQHLNARPFIRSVPAELRTLLSFCQTFKWLRVESRTQPDPAPTPMRTSVFQDPGALEQLNGNPSRSPVP